MYSFTPGLQVTSIDRLGPIVQSLQDNDITMKVNVKLEDGRQFEQLKFDPDNTTFNFKETYYACLN
jgi:hypothetical protein